MRVSNLKFDPVSSYTAFFCSLGFESRSRFIAQSIAPRAEKRYCVGFDDRHVLSYESNRAYYESQQFDIVQLSDEQLTNWLDEIATELDTQPMSERRILVDVSSMSRTRIGSFVEKLCLRTWSVPTTIDFIYALAAFSEPAEDSDVPNTHVGPVSAKFAGWAVQPELVPSVILGLGYEQDRALGAVEHIEPANVWAFRPVSELTAYEVALRTANEILFEIIPASHIIDYDVLRPFECFGKLQSLASVAGSESNPILVPFGPKIFALCALLVAALDRRCAVWRVSAEGADVALERHASGHICGLSVTLSVR